MIETPQNPSLLTEAQKQKKYRSLIARLDGLMELLEDYELETLKEGDQEKILQAQGVISNNSVRLRLEGKINIDEASADLQNILVELTEIAIKAGVKPEALNPKNLQALGATTAMAQMIELGYPIDNIGGIDDQKDS